MNLPWWILPATAAALWGLMYALYDILYKHISIPVSLFYFALASCASYALVLLVTKTPFRLSNSTAPLDSNILLLFLLTVLIAVTCNFLMGYAIKNSGASFASIIEICYPLFTLLFGYLIFRNQIANLGWFLGGSALVLLGVSIIILKAKS